MPTSADIRRQFIDFFVAKHGHTFVPSSPVVPFDDPTLLFANAGMNQFKPYFLGTQAPPYPRAANTQKCIRAGGKHNDLDDVGKDTYHHTFFEMLGNWSFGDYFKKEAIAWAWELLVDQWGIDPTRLHATYFQGDESEGLAPDNEARDLWLQYLPKERVHPGNKKDNFWEMGDTGPCGPCSEIHIDRTPRKDGGSLVNGGDARVMEIWNLVFIQFNRDAAGKLSPLPARHVDTGMGFERICAVLASKDRDYDPAIGNYDTDVFLPLFDAIRGATGAPAYTGKLDSATDTAYRVIADHIRTLTFALTDGAHCGNDGRSYVLRRILRRAVRYGRQTLGKSEPFFYTLVPTVVATMGAAFPELKKNPQAVMDELRDEEESFGRTLDRGIELDIVAATDAFEARLNKEGKLKQRAPRGWETLGATWQSTFSQWDYRDERTNEKSTMDMLIQTGGMSAEYVLINVPVNPESFRRLIQRFCQTPPQIAADDAFQLHDTYGFPLDLTQVMAQERGMTVDVAGFNALMEEAREKARGGGGGGVDVRASLVEAVQKHNLTATQFIGYDTTELPQADMPVVLFKREPHGYEKTDAIAQGDEVAIVLAKTPFYAEQGGQVGDRGVIQFAPGSSGGARVNVTDTIKAGDVFFHLGTVISGSLRGVGTSVPTALALDRTRRAAIAANHTTTHVLNHKLRAVLGDHIQQRGSLVDDEKTRFDFAHNAAIPPEKIEAIEELVAADIAADLPVFAQVHPQEAALKIHGLRAVFGEKYPPQVRVVTVGKPASELLQNPGNADWYNLSVEFCGGTHLPSTGAAQAFAIVSEESVAKGVRRITGLTGLAAQEARHAGAELLRRLNLVKSNAAALGEQLRAELGGLIREAAETTMPLTLRHRVQAALTDLQKVVKDLDKSRQREAAADVTDAARAIADENSGPIIVARLDTPGETDALRTAMDVIRKRHPDAAALLGGVVSDNKVAFIAAVPKALIDAGLKAGDWVKQAATVCGGGGGGRPDSAQAGGKDPAKLDEALEAARAFAASKMK
jgi:alanyl-tRNA synthetase